MKKINDYELALMSEIAGKKCEPLKLYVEVVNTNQIRYKALDSANKGHEGIITKYDAFKRINWHLLDNNNLNTFLGSDIRDIVFSLAIDRGHIPMTRNRKLRRVGQLCLYFAKNYAYYKAGIKAKISNDTNDFWITAQNNFLDIAILEWSKLFLQPKNSKYHWKKIVRNKDDFQKLVEQYDHRVIETYRNKFVAHLDSRIIMNIPILNGALSLACSLYSDVYSQLEDSLKLDMPNSLQDWYNDGEKQAIKFYP